MYRVTTDMEHEMHDHTVNNWSHRNSNKRFKEPRIEYTRCKWVGIAQSV